MNLRIKAIRLGIMIWFFMTIISLPAVQSSNAIHDDEYAAYVVTVRGQQEKADDLPVRAYEKNHTVMIPLRRTAEALGYTVVWDEQLKRAKLEMGIAYMFFTPGMNTYERIGKLKHINLQYAYEFAAAPELIGGIMYVPAEVFTAFFNDVSIEGSKVVIAPQMAYLTTAEA